ncbi:unnamed protein product [Brachionus calyciflorus]|uniref:Uncharacterized protein n=1 Tax=Brachionus calyciflorus TaxID=104777 RepID=A0A813MDG3_9BILA|nr:unnamed protein product [Brachionus calyciflorus]
MFLKQAERSFGYITHKGKQQHLTRKLRNSSTQVERKISDLDFADDIAQLENDPKKAQDQLNSYSENAKKVGLLINVGKTVQTVFNIENSVPLVHDRHPISTVGDFKYLGSYIRSSEKDIDMRIGLTWTAIICGIKQSEVHLTNEELYKIVKQRPISVEIRKRQLKFIGHCLMPPEEPANIYALYQSKVRERNKMGRPTAQYIEQISRFLTNDNRVKLTTSEITNPADDDDEIGKVNRAKKKQPVLVLSIKIARIKKQNIKCQKMTNDWQNL